MFQTKYISLDEFRDYFQLDLRAKFRNEEEALGFLKRIEDRVELFINSNFNRNIDLEYPKFTEIQKKYYKLALLEQSIYIFKNSDISVDSGYDVDRGTVVSRDDIIKLSIAPNAEQYLRLAGLWNRNLHRHITQTIWWR